MVPNVKTSFSTLSGEETGKLVCIPCILVGANLEVGVMSLMKRTLRACNWRLTVCEGGYAASDVGELHQVMAPLLMMIVIIATAPSLGLLPVNLFRVMRITIISGEWKVRLVKVWAMMLWAGLLIRFLNHLLLVGLREENFLDGLLSQHLPCITANKTL